MAGHWHCEWAVGETPIACESKNGEHCGGVRSIRHACPALQKMGAVQPTMPEALTAAVAPPKRSDSSMVLSSGARYATRSSAAIARTHVTSSVSATCSGWQHERASISTFCAGAGSMSPLPCCRPCCFPTARCRASRTAYLQARNGSSKSTPYQSNRFWKHGRGDDRSGRPG